MMRTAAIFALLMGMTAPAAAQTITFHTTGSYQNVRAVIVGTASGGFVSLEPGTILSSRNPHEQDLALGAPIEADLEPGERREIVVPTFCLHSDRSPPASGQTMHVVGRVDSDVLRVIYDANANASGVHQSAIWALRSGSEPHGDARTLLDRLRLRVKPRRRT